MSSEALTTMIREYRAGKGLPPADNELRAYLDESRAEQGLPPELSEAQFELARAILASAGLVVVDGAA